MAINDYHVCAKLLDSSDTRKMYHCFTDSKIGVVWLETHIFITKYCLQIAKCNGLECFQPMHTNVQLWLSLFLSWSISYQLKSKKVKHKTICGFYEGLALQQLRANEKCMKLPYDLYCPSKTVNIAEEVCPNACFKKICKTKELLKFHL